MTVHRFTVVLEPHGVTAAVMTLPDEISSALGTRSRLSVRGTINGVAFRNSVMPTGDGSFYMAANRQIREQAGVTPGDTIDVELEPDLEPRIVEVPDDLREVLAAEPDVAAAFERMPVSHRRDYVEWITEAKRPETRERRVAKAVEMIREGRRQR